MENVVDLDAEGVFSIFDVSFEKDYISLYYEYIDLFCFGVDLIGFVLGRQEQMYLLSNISCDRSQVQMR